MTLRTWVYNTLLNDPALMEFHHGRVFQTGAVTTAKTPKPYLVYHIGNDTNEDLSELNTAHRRFFQVFVHDTPGDYMQIDAIGERIKVLFHGVGNPAEQIIMARFLERSQDLDDQVMGTIFNYLRFQTVYGQ